jgi:hypothetical protein
VIATVGSHIGEVLWNDDEDTTSLWPLLPILRDCIRVAINNCNLEEYLAGTIVKRTSASFDIEESERINLQEVEAVVNCTVDLALISLRVRIMNRLLHSADKRNKPLNLRSGGTFIVLLEIIQVGFPSSFTCFCLTNCFSIASVAVLESTESSHKMVSFYVSNTFRIDGEHA